MIQKKVKKVNVLHQQLYNFESWVLLGGYLVRIHGACELRYDCVRVEGLTSFNP